MSCRPRSSLLDPGRNVSRLHMLGSSWNGTYFPGHLIGDKGFAVFREAALKMSRNNACVALEVAAVKPNSRGVRLELKGRRVGNNVSSRNKRYSRRCCCAVRDCASGHCFSIQMKRYYITDRKAVGGFHNLLEIIRDQLHMGVDYIQIREKDLSARELFEFSLAVLETRARETDSRAATKILLNARADVALAIGADGVHLPSDAPNETLPGLLVARSCHTLDEVKWAQADFVVFGPVFQGHNHTAGLGLAHLKAACGLGKPVFALGGVDWDNAAECVASGAQGIAGIRLFQQPTF